MKYSANFKNKILYMIRWQVAGIVYPLPIYYFGTLYGTIAGSFIGAFIFWTVDKYLTHPNKGVEL